MASSEHIELSDFIKHIHENLRNNAKVLGTEEAWRKHCQDEENLQKYANAMQNLAVKHWEVNNCKEQSKAVSRVEWTCNICDKYFNSALIQHRQKESDIAIKINLDLKHLDLLDVKKCGKLKLLDVGSCYNPFSDFTSFETLAIDISPANNKVWKCDFLSLELGDRTIKSSLGITQLSKNSFHVVVFSLLLEYLPSPKQRYQCCEKAYNLLVLEGLLVIITPDSKHVGANAKYMKSWRFVLSKIGFSRIKYEKLPHIHCMAFRKSLHKAVPQRWAELHKSERSLEGIFIPQDFREDKSGVLEVKKVDFNYEDLKNCFNELPDCGD